MLNKTVLIKLSERLLVSALLICSANAFASPAPSACAAGSTSSCPGGYHECFTTINGASATVCQLTGGCECGTTAAECFYHTPICTSSTGSQGCVCYSGMYYNDGSSNYHLCEGAECQQNGKFPNGKNYSCSDKASPQLSAHSYL